MKRRSKFIHSQVGLFRNAANVSFPEPMEVSQFIGGVEEKLGNKYP
jgi:hypothetical protein